MLQGPSDATSVAWPTNSLVLKWSTVPYATKYIVTIATDPALSSPVLGSVAAPFTTVGRTYAFSGTLAPGPYYWAITPLDEAGHRGQRSAIGSFTWSWLTTSTTTVVDANAAPSVYDPLFSWTPVPGAASYDVEVNSSHDWAPGSKICCTDHTIGTSLAPLKPIKNNVYYWRVRALDAAGNAGQWNEGPSFQKDFDPAVPSIPNLRIRDNAGDLVPHPSTATPIISWDPVPGAASYTVQIVRFTGVCDWAAPRFPAASAANAWSWIDNTAGTNWTFLAGQTASSGPVPVGSPLLAQGGPTLVAGDQYCVRVRARSDRYLQPDNPNDDDGFISDWTQINGLGQSAFSYQNPASIAGVPPVPFASPVATYVTPAAGSVHERLPLFTWNPVPGAGGTGWSSRATPASRRSSTTRIRRGRTMRRVPPAASSPRSSPTAMRPRTSTGR